MSYTNHFLFSETYLNDVISSVTGDEKKEYITLLENIKDWYLEYMSDWTTLEDVVIDTLGFEKSTEGKFRVLTADIGGPVVGAYLLGTDCDLDSTIKGEYYAVDAVKFARIKNLDWVIVTNGIQWRLYSSLGVSPFEFYLEADLSQIFVDGWSCDILTSVLFGRMFSANSFRHNDNGICRMNEFKEASNGVEETVEEALRSKAETVLKGLCYGLKENMDISVFTEETRKEIYGDAIILLYRLLFLGYAEARDLLPVVKDDPDYPDSFSALCKSARDYCVSGRLPEVANEYDLWDRLDSQLRIYVDKNYNGGLFSNDDKPILREHRIANAHLAGCLMELAYIAGRKKDYLQKIEYKDLSVRNLGAIYEGLLEYQLFIADEVMVQRKSKDKVTYMKASTLPKLTNSDKNNLVRPGEIYLSQDALERKETGAYYTPEDVVEYIVKNTVGRKLNELKVTLDEELAELKDTLSYEPVELNRKMIQREIDDRTIDFISEKILKLSIIDSAMGSGHFLVNAAYYTANFIVELLSENNWINADVNSDIVYWKRKVVENCIYGIDINPLSVSLSRLSLWLISASNDKALSFIDHHLKCGNSIIGTTLKKVQYQDKDYPILTVTDDNYMQPVLKKYELIREVGSDTKADVARQQEIYDEITDELAVVKRKLDYYLASEYAGGISDPAEFRRVLTASSMDDFDESYQSLFEYADQNQFFHWEIEFPEVYLKGGFDVYLGNPPYVEADVSAYKDIIYTNSCHNLYTFIIETTLGHCTKNADFGVILPSACVSTPRMAPFQKYLIDNTSNISFAVFDDRPGKLFQRLQHMRAAIVIGTLGKREAKEIMTTKYIRWFSDERARLFSSIKYAPTPYYNLVEGNIPKVGESIENSIIQKVFSCEKTVADYIDEDQVDNAVYYGYGVQYWIKASYLAANQIDTNARKSTGEKVMRFKRDMSSKIFMVILNSNLFYWYFVLFSDCRNLTRTVISRLPINLDNLSDEKIQKMCCLAEELMDDYIANSNLKTATYTGTGKIVYREYSVRKSRDIINKADYLMGEIYGLNNDEIEFLQNYDVKFRIGED